jgi:hypothetical protein
VSDNHHVRAKARELYGEKVLTAVDAKIEHTSNEAGLEEAQALEGMRTAIGEHWAFGMTDYQVGRGSAPLLRGFEALIRTLTQRVSLNFLIRKFLNLISSRSKP